MEFRTDEKNLLYIRYILRMYLFFFLTLTSYVWLVPFNYITEKSSSDQSVKDSFRIIREKKGQQLFCFFEGERRNLFCLLILVPQ